MSSKLIATPVNSNTDALTLQAYADCKKELENLLNLLISHIRNKIPKAKDFLPKNKDKITRPANSNIIYTNLLNKLGLLKIAREFCENNKINKQHLVPITKKISKILWKEIPDVHKKFFDELANEVAAEHKRLYPNYKYEPKRRIKKDTTYKHYKPKMETPDFENQVPNHSIDQQSAIEGDQMEEDYYSIDGSQDSQDFVTENDDDSQDSQDSQDFGMEIDDYSVDSPPTFRENPPHPPLEVNVNFYTANESQGGYFLFYPEPNNSASMDSNYEQNQLY